MRAIGIIPARYDSKRFPGKPLVEIEGKSMIQRVYEQAEKCESLTDLVVATDDQRIFDHVSRFGKVIMTDSGHSCGTDRCLEAFEKFYQPNGFGDNDLLINIQGDQPFVLPEQITTVIQTLGNDIGCIASLMTKITDPVSLHQKDVVKVVVDKYNKAMYFSRSPIPFRQNDSLLNNNPIPVMKHLGIYGFCIKILKQLCRLPQSNLELSEGLEQLRWLENGFKVQMAESDFDSIGIDRREDIFQFRETI